MKAADVRTQIDSALDQLITDLEGGKSESLTRYLTTMSRFHHYSWGNIMLIISQCPVATRVAGFRAWNAMSRYVRRGEKGIAIFAPMMLKALDKAEPAPFTANNIHEEKSTTGRILRFRVVYVFDISQTAGEPLPEPVRIDGDPAEYLGRLHRFVRSTGIDVIRDETLTEADGVSQGGKIRLSTALCPAEEFGVLAHEFAHERLHRGADRKEISKTVRETEAEAVAFVVCQSIGLTTGTSCSDYIQMYQGGRDTLGKSLGRVQAVAAEILAAVLQDDSQVIEEALSVAD